MAGGHFIYLIRKVREMAVDEKVLCLLGPNAALYAKTLLEKVPAYNPEAEDYLRFRLEMEHLRKAVEDVAKLVADPASFQVRCGS